MAGPIDTRVNPTKVNELAHSKPLRWFEDNVIATVPMRYPGALPARLSRLPPGVGFMSMNLDRHVRHTRSSTSSLVRGTTTRRRMIEDFYDEYFAVLDMPAEFYLETVDAVFQTRTAAPGELLVAGPAGGAGGDQPARRCSPSRARRTTSAASARPSPPRSCAPASSRRRSAITSNPASATTACSAEAAGNARSTRSSAFSSWPTTESGRPGLRPAVADLPGLELHLEFFDLVGLQVRRIGVHSTISGMARIGST